MESILILLGAFVLSIPVIAVLALILAQKAAGRAHLLEMRLAQAEAEILRLAKVVSSQDARETPPEEPRTEASAQPAPEEPESERAEEPAPEEPNPEAFEAPPEEAASPPPQAAPAAAPPVRAKPDMEALLGGRWAVWVGGLALALGGIFLVRYSIAQGLLGPGVRVALGALFALALLAAGEWLRQGSRIEIPGLGPAHAPAVVTAAGSATAFAVALSAYGLYGFIGPGLAFLLLGLIAVATLLAAVLHGPVLAPLGVLGAFATPLLIGGGGGAAWALVPYFAAVAISAYGVAHLRGWSWLRTATLVCAALWAVLLTASEIGPGRVHILLQALLAGLFFVALPQGRDEDGEAELDGGANAALWAFAVLGIFALAVASVTSASLWFPAALALLLLYFGTRHPAAATANLAAAAVVAAAIAVWPLVRLTLADPVRVLPGALAPSPVEPAVTTLLAFAILGAGAIAGASFWRLATSARLKPGVAGTFCAAMASGPLLVLLATYWSINDALDVLHGARHLDFAVAAGLLGLGYVLAANVFARRVQANDGPAAFGLAAAAVAALSALSLGLVFWLDKGMLTVAFALSALAAAHVAQRTGIAALRYGVAALGAIVVGRLVWDPMIGGGDPGRAILFNWLLWGYGIPAACFFFASRILERGGRDRIARFAEGLAILFSALLVFFQIRHALHVGDPLAGGFDHLEAGLFTVAGIGFALVMTRIDARRPDVVTRVAGIAFGAITLATAAIGLGFAANPLLTDERLLGGPVFNSLLPAYLLPTALCLLLARAARESRPYYYVASAAGLALALHLLWTIMAVRAFFQFPRVGLWRATSEAELWTYSLVLLATGLAFLAIGIWRDRARLRELAAAYLVVAVVKVFLVDLANLEGVMRALSFIGLGIVLLGIGLTYQKLLARRAARMKIAKT